MTAEHIAKLKSELKKKEYWTTKEVKVQIKEKFGVEYSDDQIVRILRNKLKMHFSKPFPVDYRRPEDADAILEIKNTTKFKTNTIGFYAIKGESVKEFLENSKKESIASILETINKAKKEYKAIVVIDNFRTHKSTLVKEKAKELGIYLVYLPPYSPDLNPSEYIWRSIKRMLSLVFVKSLDDMKTVISDGWNKFSKCLSYAEG